MASTRRNPSKFVNGRICKKNEIEKNCWKVDHNLSWYQKKIVVKEKYWKEKQGNS